MKHTKPDDAPPNFRKYVDEHVTAMLTEILFHAKQRDIPPSLVCDVVARAFAVGVSVVAKVCAEDGKARYTGNLMTDLIRNYHSIIIDRDDQSTKENPS